MKISSYLYFVHSTFVTFYFYISGFFGVISYTGKSDRFNDFKESRNCNLSCVSFDYLSVCNFHNIQVSRTLEPDNSHSQSEIEKPTKVNDPCSTTSDF